MCAIFQCDLILSSLKIIPMIFTSDQLSLSIQSLLGCTKASELEGQPWEAWGGLQILSEDGSPVDDERRGQRWGVEMVNVRN